MRVEFVDSNLQLKIILFTSLFLVRLCCTQQISIDKVRKWTSVEVSREFLKILKLQMKKPIKFYRRKSNFAPWRLHQNKCFSLVSYLVNVSAVLRLQWRMENEKEAVKMETSALTNSENAMQMKLLFEKL